MGLHKEDIWILKTLWLLWEPQNLIFCYGISHGSLMICIGQKWWEIGSAQFQEFWKMPIWRVTSSLTSLAQPMLKGSFLFSLFFAPFPWVTWGWELQRQAKRKLNIAWERTLIKLAKKIVNCHIRLSISKPWKISHRMPLHGYGILSNAQMQ